MMMMMTIALMLTVQPIIIMQVTAMVYGGFRRRRRNKFRHSIKRILRSSSEIRIRRTATSIPTTSLSSTSGDTFPPHLQLRVKITHKVSTASRCLASSVYRIFMFLLLLDFSLTGSTQFGLLKAADGCQKICSTRVDWQ